MRHAPTDKRPAVVLSPGWDTSAAVVVRVGNPAGGGGGYGQASKWVKTGPFVARLLRAE